MKVVFLSQSFARNMGYLENMLPKYLGRAGAEVHVITTDLPLYHHMGDAEQTYKGFAEPEKRAGRIEECENFTLHVLGHRKVLGHTWMSGLRSWASCRNCCTARCPSIWYRLFIATLSFSRQKKIALSLSGSER